MATRLGPPMAVASAAAEPDFRFATGDVVLVKWDDGKLYYAKIRRIDRKTRKCVILFDDLSRGEANFTQIHSVTETTTEIVCIVCKGEVSEAPDEIVLCDKCGVGYHQRCHSPNIPDTALKEDEPWECTYCLRTVPNPHVYESMNPFLESQRRGFCESPPPTKKRRLFGSAPVWPKHDKTRASGSFSSPREGPRLETKPSSTGDDLLVPSFSSPANALPPSARSGSDSCEESCEAPFEGLAFGGDDFGAKRERNLGGRKQIVETGAPKRGGSYPISDSAAFAENRGTGLQGNDGVDFERSISRPITFHQSPSGAEDATTTSTSTDSPSTHRPSTSSSIGRVKRRSVTSSLSTIHVPRTRTPNRATGRISVFMKRRLEKTGSLKAGSPASSRNAPIMASRAPKVLPKLRPDNQYETIGTTASATSSSSTKEEEENQVEDEKSGDVSVKNDGTSSSTEKVEEVSGKQAANSDEFVEEVELEDGIAAAGNDDSDDADDVESKERQQSQQSYSRESQRSLHEMSRSLLNQVQTLSATDSVEVIDSSGGESADEDLYTTGELSSLKKDSAGAEDFFTPSTTTSGGGAASAPVCNLADSPVSSTSSTTIHTSAAALGGSAGAGGGKMISATAIWRPEKPLTLEMLKRMNEDQKQWSPDSEGGSGGGRGGKKSHLPEIPALSRTARTGTPSVGSANDNSRIGLGSRPTTEVKACGSAASSPAPWDADLRSFASSQGQVDSVVEFQRVHNKLMESRKRKQSVTGVQRRVVTSSSSKFTVANLVPTTSGKSHSGRAESAKKRTWNTASSGSGIIEYSSRELQEQSLEQLFADVNKRMQAGFEEGTGGGKCGGITRTRTGSTGSIRSTEVQDLSLLPPLPPPPPSVTTTQPPPMRGGISESSSRVLKRKDLVIATSTYDKRYAEMDQEAIMSQFEACFANFDVSLLSSEIAASRTTEALTPPAALAISTAGLTQPAAAIAATENILSRSKLPPSLPTVSSHTSSQHGTAPVTISGSGGFSATAATVQQQQRVHPNIGHAAVTASHYRSVHSPSPGGVLPSPRTPGPHQTYHPFENATTRSLPPSLPPTPSHPATVAPAAPLASATHAPRPFVPPEKYDSRYAGHHMAVAAAVPSIPPQPSHVHVPPGNPQQQGQGQGHLQQVPATAYVNVMTNERLPVMVSSSPPGGHQAPRSSVLPQPPPSQPSPLGARRRGRVPEPGPHPCRVCTNVAAYLCSGCQRAWYCSPRCQMSDWGTHSKLCDHNK